MDNILKIKVENDLLFVTGNVKKNVETIIEATTAASDEGIQVVMFPELCLTGGDCGDMFLSSVLQDSIERGILSLYNFSFENKSMIMIVGCPEKEGNKIYNSVYVITDGKVVGIVRKESATGGVFSRGQRADRKVFKFFDSLTIGIEIGEDALLPVSPSTEMVCSLGAEVILNPWTMEGRVMVAPEREGFVVGNSSRLLCGYVSTHNSDFLQAESAVCGIPVKGDTVAIDRDIINGLRSRATKNKTFKEIPLKDIEDRVVKVQKDIKLGCDDPSCLVGVIQANPFLGADGSLVMKGLKKAIICTAKKLSGIGNPRPVIGVSGGSDSTLALLITVLATKATGSSLKNIIGVTMPGYATSGRTYLNSTRLMEAFGIDTRDIIIKDICDLELKALGHDGKTQDITYENVQARARTEILMNLSNKEGGIVIGTGDMSEAALGWCTYNGDHMSMYNVNAGFPKTVVKYILEQFTIEGSPINTFITEEFDLGECNVPKLYEFIRDVVNTPVSPELKTDQRTEDVVGPYELVDFFLYYTVKYGMNPKKIEEYANCIFSGRYGDVEIHKYLENFIKRFITQQFKRTCSPEGPRVGEISLSPIDGWRVPTDISPKEWMEYFK